MHIGNTTNSEDEIMPHLMLLTDFTVIMVYSIKSLQLSQVALSLPSKTYFIFLCGLQIYIGLCVCVCVYIP